MARGVRQGCPASGFLFVMAFDSIFRWLQETIIPRNPDNLNFLQPAQCAYADDLAVASSSYVLQVGMDVALSFPKACGVLLGTPGVSLDRSFPRRKTGSANSIISKDSENCGEFREMEIVRHAKHVGTMIGPDGHIHRWSAPWKKSSSAC